MKQNVQILLLCASMLSLPAFAEEEPAKETMEERKQRIMRKYLRERVDITYSDEEVPGDRPYDDIELAREDFEEENSEFAAAEGRRAVPPPVRYRARLTENRNWLLGDMDETGEAGASSADTYGQEMEEPGAVRDTWDVWGTDTKYSRDSESETESGFSRSRFETFRRESADSYSSGTEGENPFFRRTAPYGEEQPRGYPQTGSRQPDPYSRQEGTRQSSEAYPYGAAPAQNPYYPSMDSQQPSSVMQYYQRSSPAQNPYATQQEQLPGQEHIHPYSRVPQSPYEQRRQQWETMNESQQQYQYSQPDAYQEWKKTNPGQFNPTGDDAYLQEHMPRVR